MMEPVASTSAESESLNILDIPEEILESILQSLSYNEISESRRVCKTFNKTCQRLLNQGFTKVDKQHAFVQKDVKNKLPRRESERRNHPLSRHVDILSALETRLSLLGMTYMKYIDMDMCCFIPGKVLDELNSILVKLRSPKQPPRSHELLQELRDISSMAMEHFDERIAPALKARIPSVSPLQLPYPFNEPYNCSSIMMSSGSQSPHVHSMPSSPVIRGTPQRSEISRLGIQLRSQSGTVQQCRKEVIEVKNTCLKQRMKVMEQEKKLYQQSQTIQELEKKVNDLNQKFTDISAELVKLKNVKDTNESPQASVSHVLNSDKFSTEEGLSLKKTDDDTKHLKYRRNPKRKAKAGLPEGVKKSKR